MGHGYGAFSPGGPHVLGSEFLLEDLVGDFECLLYALEDWDALHLYNVPQVVSPLFQVHVFLLGDGLPEDQTAWGRLLVQDQDQLALGSCQEEGKGGVRELVAQ